MLWHSVCYLRWTWLFMRIDSGAVLDTWLLKGGLDYAAHTLS